MNIKLESKIIKNGDRFEATVENGNVMLIPIKEEFIPKNGDWLVFEDEPSYWSGEGAYPFGALDYPYLFKALNVKDERSDDAVLSDFSMIDKLGYGHAYSKGDKLRLATKEEIEKVEPSEFRAGQVWIADGGARFLVLHGSNYAYLDNMACYYDFAPVHNIEECTYLGMIEDVLKGID